MATPQSYANHKRYVAAYHYVAFPLLLLNFVWSIKRLIDGVDIDRLMYAGLSLAVLIATFYARAFAAAAQDRVIRIEEQMRLGRLLPDDLRARIGELRLSQLVALRFASDEELPELVRRVLDDGLRRQDAIKRAIRTWRPDTERV